MPCTPGSDFVKRLEHKVWNRNDIDDMDYDKRLRKGSKFSDVFSAEDPVIRCSPQLFYNPGKAVGGLVLVIRDDM